MKIVSFKRQSSSGEEIRLGILENQHLIIDVNLIWKKFYENKNRYQPKFHADLHAPKLLSEFLKKHQESSTAILHETVDLYKQMAKAGNLTTLDGGNLAFDLRDDKSVNLTKPLDSIHCYRDFFAHEKHVKVGFEKRGEQIPEAWYELPVYYKGATAGFIGPDELMKWPSYSDLLDYELELGIIIGRDGKNIKEDHALDYIFGYTILNDVSARDIQKKEMSCRLGPAKAKDFCSIIGPVIVTQDEFHRSEPNLRMTATINGELWSNGLSGDANYSFSQMIDFASRDEWILATDFMGSGTVGTGCGLEINKWIKSGDVVELEIEKIGKLKNIVGIKGQ
jgi:2-keto-4-pentenoate hydratase/2-oxohepta-3-ene-1,7-dioic acid hydratase in catechol pathway